MKVIDKVKEVAGKVKAKIVEKKKTIIKGGLILGGTALALGAGVVALNKINGDYDEFELEDDFEEIELEELDPREVIEGEDE